MEMSEIIMETFTLGLGIGLNTTRNASFCSENVAWNRARLHKCTHEINPTGKFPKRSLIREYGSLAKQVFGSVLFD